MMHTYHCRKCGWTWSVTGFRRERACPACNSPRIHQEIELSPPPIPIPIGF